MPVLSDQDDLLVWSKAMPVCHAQMPGKENVEMRQAAKSGLSLTEEIGAIFDKVVQQHLLERPKFLAWI